MFKQNDQFEKLQKDLYKKLSQIEIEIKDQVARKKVTVLIEKTYNLKGTQNSKVLKLIENVSSLVTELKREMVNPVDLIINNYIEKIDSMLNKVTIESEV